MDSEPQSSFAAPPTKPAKKKTSKGALAFGCLFAAVGIMALVVALSVGPVVESIVEAELESHGYTCTPLDLDVSLLGGSATLAATECRSAEGPIEVIRTDAPSTITLSGFRPDAIEVASLVVELRPRARADVGEDFLVNLASLREVHEHVGRLLMDGAQLSQKDYPELTIGTLRLIRGAVIADLTQVSLQSEVGRWQLTAPQMRFAGGAGTEVTDLSTEFTPTAATASANVDARTSLLGIQVGARVSATISASGLDTPNPTFRLSL